MTKIGLPELISLRNVSYLWGLQYVCHAIGAMVQGPAGGYKLMSGLDAPKDTEGGSGKAFSDSAWAYYSFFTLYMMNGIAMHIYTARLPSEQSQRKMAMLVMLPHDLAVLAVLWMSQEVFATPAFWTLFGRTATHLALVLYNVYRIRDTSALSFRFKKNWLTGICLMSALWGAAHLFRLKDLYGGAEFWDHSPMLTFLWQGSSVQIAAIVLSLFVSAFLLDQEEQRTCIKFLIFNMLVWEACWFTFGLADEFLKRNGMDPLRCVYMAQHIGLLLAWNSISPATTWPQVWSRAMQVVIFKPTAMLCNAPLALQLHAVPAMDAQASLFASVLLFKIGLMSYVGSEKLNTGAQRTMFEYLRMAYPFWIYSHFSGRFDAGPGIYWDCISFALINLWLNPGMVGLPDQGLGGGAAPRGRSKGASPSPVRRKKSRSASMKKQR